MKNLSILLLVNLIFLSAVSRNLNSVSKEKIPSLHGKLSVSEDVLANILMGADKFFENNSEDNIVHNLDSIVVDNFERETGEWSRYFVYKYGTEKIGNTEYYNAYFWDETDKYWKSFTIRLAEFDENDSIIHLVEYPSTSIRDTGMVYSQKEEYYYTYSSEGKTEEYIQFHKDTYGFFYSFKEKTVFDNYGNLIEYSYYSWNNMKKEWHVIRTFEHYYDEHGNEIKAIENYFSAQMSDTIIGTIKNVFEFDENGNNIIYLGYVWDKQNREWIINEKINYTYDNNKNKISETNYSWDTDSLDWVGTTRIFYEYNSNNYLTLVEQGKWDNILNEWIYVGKFVFGFDEGKRTLFSIYNWDTTQNIWVGMSKEEEEYNQDGDITLRAYFSWNGETNEWIGYKKEVYSYNENGEELFITDFIWNEEKNEWVGNFKEEYYYDEYANNYLTSVFKWDTLSSDWNFKYDKFKTEFKYNDSGKKTEEVNLNWDEDLNDLVNVKKYEYDYDYQGRIILYVESDWSDEKEDWVQIVKNEYGFDEFDNCILDVTYNYHYQVDSLVLNTQREYQYDSEGRPLLNSELKRYGGLPEVFIGNKTIYEYDESGRLITYGKYSWDNTKKIWVGAYKTESVFDDYGFPLLEYISNWDMEIDEWYLATRSTYYYTLVSAPEIELDSDKLLVYPNPATDYIIFDFKDAAKFATLTVFDICGKMVLSEKINQGKSISTSELSNGIYFYSLDVDSDVIMGKFIINR